MGNVQVTATGVAASSILIGWVPGRSPARYGDGRSRCRPCGRRGRVAERGGVDEHRERAARC